MNTSARSGIAELNAARRTGIGLLAMAFAFSIVVNALMLVGPLYMLQVYDRVLASRSVETLVALSALVTLLYVLMAVLDYARGRVMARVGARFQTELDGRLFDIALARSTNPQERAASGAALKDLDSVQGLFVSPILLALMDMPWTPVFVAAIFLFHPVLGWLAVVGAGIIVVLALLNQLFTLERTRKSQIQTQQAHMFAEHARQGSEVALSQGLAGNMRKRYLRQRNEALVATMAANDWTGSFTSATKAFRLFMQSAMLGVGAYFVILGEMTGGSMIAGSILLGRALAPIEQAMGNWPVLQRARAGWANLARFLASAPPVAQRTSLPIPAPTLQATSLAIVPPGGRVPTVRNLSFSIGPGQALGVIGRSGSGKSSLARTLCGYWRVAGGEVRLGGATLEQYDPEALAQHVGYLPQTVTLFAGTVSENIARMSLVPDDIAVVTAAKRANAHEMIMQLPDGYDTYLDGNENQLSGGQRQRIALARALYGNPVLLILDEPNSMLDAEGSEALNETVREFKQSGRSVIIMTHRPKAIAECETLMVMENGAMAAFGPRDKVMEETLSNAEPVRRSLERKVAF